MSFSLKLLGGLTLAGEHGPLTGPAVQRHRLALLALLACARPRAVSRDKLMAWLWPERESEPARRLLNQAVHALRQALGPETILSAGEELQLNPAAIECDVIAFEEALGAGAPDRAVPLYGGPFLDGFYLDDAPELERWVDRERDRLAAAHAKAVESLAEVAERAGDSSGAVDWWKARSAHDPYDSRVALRLMQALERAGNRAGALQHAAAHQQLLREELEIEPPAEVRALVDRLRRAPAALEAAVERLGADQPSAPLPPPAPADAVAPRRPPPRRFQYAALALLLAAAVATAAILLPSRTDETRAAASPRVVDQIAKAVAR